MSLHMTPQGDRTQIAIYGKRNAGKSSLINAITGQPLAIVSDVKGTNDRSGVKSNGDPADRTLYADRHTGTG